MEFLIAAIQMFMSVFFIAAIITLFDSKTVEEFCVGVAFCLLFLSLSFIPHSFRPCTLKESVFVESELLEHKDSIRLMVDKDKIYKINGWKEVTKLKMGQFNVYKQRWENKYGLASRNQTRVFDFEGNLILDL